MVFEHASFQDAIAAADGERNLLAGNGMSIAFDTKKFSYAKLFDAAKFQETNPSIEKVFEALGTKDFETVARALSTAKNIAANFGQTDFANELDANITDIKSALIEAVKKNHPENSNCLTDGNRIKFQTFLSNFLTTGGNVFSLNYDALLYWSILRPSGKNSPINRMFADGFGNPNGEYVVFLGDSCPMPVNILFPHGALFLFEDNGEVYKPRSKAMETPLIEIITQKMEENFFPVFVSEGNSSQKKEAIRRNHYLNYCFEKIDETKDSFFIFGHAMNLDSDSHILEKIARNNNIKNIFASYFDSKDSTQSRLLAMRAASERAEDDLRLHIFPANTVGCW